MCYYILKYYILNYLTGDHPVPRWKQKSWQQHTTDGTITALATLQKMTQEVGLLNI
jgi:hypothetical protein